MPDDDNWIAHLPAKISAAEWEALPEDVCRRVEVVEGLVAMSPSPTRLHQFIARHLCNALEAQGPATLRSDIDADLRLNDEPLHIRRPDVVVYRADLADDATLRPEHVVLVVEVTSPGSVLNDEVVKPVVYACAGIPHYWRVDLDPLCIHTYRLVGDEYIEAETYLNHMRVEEPFAFEIDLSALKR